jgi:hypothetical protein
LKLTHQKVECFLETLESVCGSHTTDAL